MIVGYKYNYGGLLDTGAALVGLLDTALVGLISLAVTVKISVV